MWPFNKYLDDAVIIRKLAIAKYAYDNKLISADILVEEVGEILKKARTPLVHTIANMDYTRDEPNG